MPDWSDIATEAKAEARTAGPTCQVQRFLATLDADGSASVRHALANDDVTTSGLHRAIVGKVGEEAAPTLWSLGNHRRRSCACGRRGQA